MPVSVASLREESRLLDILCDGLDAAMKDSVLYQRVEEYLSAYCEFNTIESDAVVSIYTDYIAAYNKHCRYFIKTGLYPAEASLNNYQPSREAYDVVLLLSVLFTKHRFRIMELLAQSRAGGKSLYIGLGPGLELDITQDRFDEVHGYDLTLNSFLSKTFPQAILKAELYSDQYENYFDAVYLVEILEHIEDPAQLLLSASRSLRKGGKVFLTTATDIPQFDHVYHFPEDHALFDSELQQIGFKINRKETILHDYMAMNMRACNHFYEIEKI